jgi:hypothetical protein
LKGSWADKSGEITQLGGTLGTIKLKLIDAQQKV